MIQEELFVGLIAVLLGGLGIAAAVLNWERPFRLRKAQWIEARMGRAGVRVAYALIGAVLILLGLAIALGFAPNVNGNHAAGARHGKKWTPGAPVAA